MSLLKKFASFFLFPSKAFGCCCRSCCRPLNSVVVVVVRCHHRQRGTNHKGLCSVFCLLIARGKRGGDGRKGEGPRLSNGGVFICMGNTGESHIPNAPSLPPPLLPPAAPHLLSALLLPTQSLPKPRALTYISRNERKGKDKIKTDHENIQFQGGVSMPFGSHSVTGRKNQARNSPPPWSPTLTKGEKKGMKDVIIQLYFVAGALLCQGDRRRRRGTMGMKGRKQQHSSGRGCKRDYTCALLAGWAARPGGLRRRRFVSGPVNVWVR